MKTSVVDSFHDPEETPIAVDGSAKPVQEKATGPALGHLFVVHGYDHDLCFGPFESEDEAIAAAKEDFTYSDMEDDERYFLCRIAKKLRLFRPIQVDEVESEDR